MGCEQAEHAEWPTDKVVGGRVRVCGWSATSATRHQQKEDEKRPCMRQKKKKIETRELVNGLMLLLRSEVKKRKIK